MGDDQAGLRVAERLASLGLPRTSVRLSESPGVDLADGSLSPKELLVIIDAAPADNAHPAGTFLRLEHPRDGDRLKLRAGGDTHSIGVAAGLQLATTLGALPERVWIYVLFGTAFERSLDMTAAVEGGVTELAERIAADVEAVLPRKREPAPRS